MKVVTSVFAVMAIVLSTMVSSSYAQVTALFEDFEDATVEYGLFADIGTGPAGAVAISDGVDVGSGYDDYFGRAHPTNGLQVGIPFDAMYPDGPYVELLNVSGEGFFAAQDYDSVPSIPQLSAAPEVGYVIWEDIDIAGITDLQFSAKFAEDDAFDSAGILEEDWDSLSELIVEVQFDNAGPFVQIFGIQSTLAGGSVPRVDTTFDGVGDGTEITDTFQNFVVPISGTGATLDLRFTLRGLNGGNEDIAIDNVTISGVPEPSSLVLGMFALSALFMRRRVG